MEDCWRGGEKPYRQPFTSFTKKIVALVNNKIVYLRHLDLIGVKNTLSV